mmetsp:Transcript_23735/g.59403  ORF Transcript_23735/g.59403 Transcript_23735/m.59403 type:complete len:197 (+) Transcript_23735:1420-2010(+)
MRPVPDNDATQYMAISIWRRLRIFYGLKKEEEDRDLLDEVISGKADPAESLLATMVHLFQCQKTYKATTWAPCSTLFSWLSLVRSLSEFDDLQHAVFDFVVTRMRSASSSEGERARLIRDLLAGTYCDPTGRYSQVSIMTNLRSFARHLAKQQGGSAVLPRDRLLAWATVAALVRQASPVLWQGIPLGILVQLRRG